MFAFILHHVLLERARELSSIASVPVPIVTGTDCIEVIAPIVGGVSDSFCQKSFFVRYFIRLSCDVTKKFRMKYGSKKPPDFYSESSFLRYFASIFRRERTKQQRRWWWLMAQKYRRQEICCLSVQERPICVISRTTKYQYMEASIF
jgi:hypothetical protein